MPFSGTKKGNRSILITGEGAKISHPVYIRWGKEWSDVSMRRRRQNDRLNTKKVQIVRQTKILKGLISDP